jgi:hypothetical protein
VEGADEVAEAVEEEVVASVANADRMNDRVPRVDGRTEKLDN